MRAATGERTRQRARPSPATKTGGTPAPGEVWTVSPAIEGADGRVLEHSKVPLMVVVLQRTAGVFEVAPVSFETAYAAAFDVSIPALLERPALVEAWLRMPVSRRALQKPAARLSDREFREVKEQARRILVESASLLADDDPRRSYRQDERLRVIFAMAGTGEDLQFPGATTDAGHAAVTAATEKALRLKRGDFRWRREAAAAPAHLPGYRPGPMPAGRSNTPQNAQG
jgi:hypothetical protein